MRTAIAILLLLSCGFSKMATGQGTVSFNDILHAAAHPHNWLTYSGTTFSQRFTKLGQITRENANNLELKWVYQTRSLHKFEATPLVVDGVLYTVEPPNDIVALDAATGRVFWTFSYNNGPVRVCCGTVNRGLAILGDTLFMGTVDAHLFAIDAKNGRPIWKTKVARAESGYSLTHAPLVVKDKVIVGTGGGEFGIRGFIAAYDVRTGKEVWKFHTVPGPSEPGNETWAGDSWKTGGAPVWVTGSYDPEVNLTYWGTGNPSPDWNGDSRAGDNLYSDSVVALDPDTGKLKWFYQFTPHDEFDYDAAQVPVLSDMPWKGQPSKVMLWANRNGIFYVLDRRTGEFLLGRPFIKVTWMNGFDEKGRPQRVPGMAPTREGTRIFPGNAGGTSWYSPSFSPSTRLFYVSAWKDYSSIFSKGSAEYREGAGYMGGAVRSVIPYDRSPIQNYRKHDEGYGAVIALDPHTGEQKWEFRMADVTDAGILTTATDVLFSGGREGHFFALDARSGKLLWKTSLGGPVTSGPMSFALRGKQYVSVNAGNSIFVFGLR